MKKITSSSHQQHSTSKRTSLRSIIDRRARELVEQSSNQIAYTKFLERADFNIGHFFSSIELFAKGRKVVFTPLSFDKLRSREIIFGLLKTKTADTVPSIVQIIRSNCPHMNEEPYEIAAIVTGKYSEARRLLYHDNPELYKQLQNHARIGNVDSAGALFFIGEMDLETKWECLADLCEVGIYFDSLQGKLTPFNETFSVNGMSGYIACEGSEFSKGEVAGLTEGEEILVSHRNHVQHELQHVFDDFILCEREDQDIGAREYRAYIAELLFSENIPGYVAKFVMSAERSDAKIKLGLDTNNMHIIQKIKIARELNGEIQTERAIIDKLRSLLNEAYRLACDLSYDEILEPIKKSISSQ